MPTYHFTKVDVPSEVGAYEYISLDGFDGVLAVGNYGNVDGDGDQTFFGFIAESGNGLPFNPPDSTNTDIVGITSSGEIYGDYTDNFLRNHGFVFADGSFEEINYFLATATNVFGVTDAGVIYGDYVDFTGTGIHGFIDDNGTMTSLDVPGAATTSITGMNAAGEIVGTYTDAQGQGHGFTDINGSFIRIDPAGSILTNLVGVSASGEVAGTYVDASGIDHAFIDQNGVSTPIDIPGAANSGVNAVNDAGEIVGYYGDCSGNVHGFVDIDGVVSTVDVPGATETNILGIDASGDVVGYYNDSSDNQHGFVGTAIPCYCRGTLILTDDGERPVEALEIGDRVLTRSGAARPIKWIGRRSYSGRFVLGRKDILPIRIKADALDHNVPRRDLLVSPHHAMYLEGVLIEAKDLVNDVSIVRVESADRIEYFHIELDSHDIIIAEGAPSESFIDDDDSRGMFHNAHEYRALHPDETETTASYCAPRRDEGYEVEAARRRIDGRTEIQTASEQRSLALRGFVDAVRSNTIDGWALTPRHPDAPVCLDIFANGRLIGRTLANRHRADLERAGISNGRHGFSFTPPAGLTLAPETIEVRRSLDGALLPLSEEAKAALAVFTGRAREPNLKSG